MSFTAPKFTGVGRQLQTRVIAGDTLTFTTIKLGDGTMTTEPIAALTDLIHGIITLPVHEVRRNADYADVTGVFQNAGLSSGFYWREIGIFAADPDYPNDRSHDILYCYQNAAELAEYIPSASSAVIEKIIRVACVVGDAESVTVGLASQAYAKAEDLQALEEQHSKDVERINDALDAVDPTKITAKAGPSDGDGVMIADSADGGKAKRLLWSNVKAALGKLFVPLARKINGKALSKDVTLTGEDIAMGADDAETLRAAMAKLLINYGKEFASKDTILDAVMACKTTCSFFAYAGSRLFDANDRPELGAEYQYLVLMDDISGPRRTVIAYSYSAGNVFLRSVWNKKWQTDDWFPLATRKSPEVHILPLASGLTAFAHTFCNYSKTQENIVHLNVWITGPLSSNQVIGTLPEGFRPVTNYSCAAYCSYATSGNIDTRYPVKIVIQYDGLIYCYSSILDGSQFELGFAVSFVVRD